MNVVYRMLQHLMGWFFRIFFRLRVTGLCHVPPERPFLVCSNHFSNIDPVLLGTILPQRVRFMAKAEMFRWRLSTLLLRRLGAFPVRRGEMDVGAVRGALRFLRAGDAVLLFPMGTRMREDWMNPAVWHRGIAFLAFRTQVPVVPVVISGSYRWGGPLRVCWGKPIVPAAQGGSQRMEEEKLLAELVDRMRSLSEELELQAH